MKQLSIFASLVVGAILVRLPFIAASAPVGWDENTFFLVASRSAVGELPYTTTFDNKPPLAVLPQTIALFLGIDDPWALRVVAALLLATAAYFLARVGFGLRSSWWQLPVGLSFIVLFSILPEGFGWMTELNAVVIFAAAIFLFWRAWLGMRSSPVALGLLLGVLPLTRTNWALVSVAILITTWCFWRFGRFFRLTLIGAVVPAALVALLYLVAGHFSALVNGALVLPWRYANQANDLAPWSLPSNALRLYLFATTLLAASAAVRGYLGQLANINFDLLVFILASVVMLTSLAQSPDYGHHALQLTPFVALGLARAVGAVIGLPMPNLAVAISGISLCAISLLAVPLALHYQLSVTLRGMYKPESFANLAAQVQQDRSEALGAVGVSALGSVAALPNIDRASVWALDTHDIYWRLNKRPISPLLAHPSSVVEPAFLQTFFVEPTSPTKAVDEVFNLKPDVIVFESANYLSGTLRQKFKKRLETEYEKRYHLGAHPGVQVWVRLGPGA